MCRTLTPKLSISYLFHWKWMQETIRFHRCCTVSTMLKPPSNRGWKLYNLEARDNFVITTTVNSVRRITQAASRGILRLTSPEVNITTTQNVLSWQHVQCVCPTEGWQRQEEWDFYKIAAPIKREHWSVHCYKDVLEEVTTACLLFSVVVVWQ